MNKSSVSVVVVALIVGLAFGTVVFPRTTIQTTTQLTTRYTTQVTTLTVVSNNLQYPIVTVTRITVLVIPVVATCTTISGVRSIVYVYAQGGQTTTVTTIYPPNLPQEYYVTVVTASTVTASNHTYVQQPDTC